MSRILLSDSALLLVMVPARASQNFESSQKMGKTELNSGKNADKCKKKGFKGFRRPWVLGPGPLDIDTGSQNKMVKLERMEIMDTEASSLSATVTI